MAVTNLLTVRKDTGKCRNRMMSLAGTAAAKHRVTQGPRTVEISKKKKMTLA